MTRRKPSLREVRAFGLEILDREPPDLNPKYPGWENLLHEIGHAAVVPKSVENFMQCNELARVNCCKFPLWIGTLASLEMLTGFSIGHFPGRLFSKTPQGGYTALNTFCTSLCWFGHPQSNHYEQVPLAPNEWGVIAWCNQVCDVMGWHRPGKQSHWGQELDPIQVKQAHINIEKGIFRPPVFYEISDLKCGPSIKVLSLDGKTLAKRQKIFSGVSLRIWDEHRKIGVLASPIRIK